LRAESFVHLVGLGRPSAGKKIAQRIASAARSSATGTVPTVTGRTTSKAAPPVHRRASLAPASPRGRDFDFTHLKGAELTPSRSAVGLSPAALFASRLSSEQIQSMWARSIARVIGGSPIPDSRADPKIQTQWDRAFAKVRGENR
jgi:hypothetical protein